MKHHTATLALIVRDEKLLLGLKSRKGADIGEGTLNGPGGKKEENQTLLECLHQEALDEVGIEILLPEAEEVSVLEFHNGKTSVWTVHVYLVHEFIGEPKPSAEMSKPKAGWWYAFDALPFELMLAADSRWLPRVLRGERVQGVVYQNDDATILLSEPEFFPLD